MSSVFERLFATPRLTGQRIAVAFAIALGTDAFQLLLGPAGFGFADEIVDVLAMILTWRLLGFHILLLPTFVLELLPIVDVLPTWTGCVGIVIGLRKREQAAPPPAIPPGRVIDV